MDLNDLKEGDRVRLTVELEVDYLDSYDGSVKLSNPDGDLAIQVDAIDQDGLVSIEKLAPPVITFKAGDMVRHLAFRDHVYTVLPEDGYYSHQLGKVQESGADQFTSEGYELVANKDLVMARG